MNCRRCSQELPAGTDGRVVICSNCGTVGDGAELTAHAETVIAGRYDASPSAELARHRLKVRFELERPTDEGYREAAMAVEPRGVLTMRVPYFGLRSAMGQTLKNGVLLSARSYDFPPKNGFPSR